MQVTPNRKESSMCGRAELPLRGISASWKRADRHSIRFNSQMHLGHNNLMHGPRLGNKRTGSSSSERDLGVTVDNSLPRASSMALLQGGMLCYRQSTARRSVEAIISFRTAPEATRGRVSSFRPPSTRVFKLEGVRRATNVWGLMTYERLRELG